MAAYLRGVKTVVIPQANVPDLDEVDGAVKEAVSFVPVSTVDEVLKIALEDGANSAKKQMDMPISENLGERWNSVAQ